MTRAPSVLGPRGLALPPEYLAAPLVVAVSGGIDSMVLLDCLHKHPARTGTLIVAHVNYGLRAAAAADAAFVQRAARAAGVRCRVLTVRGRRPTHGVQAWARDVRYDFFLRVARAAGAPALAVAHHADDQAETVLLHLCRGGGVAALAGMEEQRPLDAQCVLVRPLLAFRRAQIERYARRTRLTWRDDASNATREYLRNAVRHEVLPVLQRVNSQVATHLTMLAAHAREAEEALALWAMALAQTLPIRAQAARWSVPCAALAAIPAAVVKRLLLQGYADVCPGRMLTSDHLDHMYALACGIGGSYALPGAHIRRAGELLQIARGELPATPLRGTRSRSK